METPAFEPGFDAQLVNTVLVLTLGFTGLLGCLLLLNDLALFVVALGREQQPALAPRQRNLPRILLQY